MTALSRLQKTIEPLPQGDPPEAEYKHSRNAQDSRILDTVSNAKQWRRFGYALVAITAVSVAGNIYQGATKQIATWIIQQDRLGNVAAMKASEKPGDVTPAELGAVAREFVRGVRTRYADGEAMKANFVFVYNHLEVGSPEEVRLTRVFNSKDGDPFKQAETKLVAVIDMHSALLPSDDSEGVPKSSRGFRTLRVEWREVTTPRDGITPPASVSRWATVSMRVSPPETEEELAKNPRGIFVYETTISLPDQQR